MKILILQGPNLNLLGQREPEKYGKTSLAQLETQLDEVAHSLGVKLDHFQSNSEGALIDRVQQAAKDGVQGAIVNAAGYSHTSIALRDVFLGTQIPLVEVHITNVFAREPFRHQSRLADIAVGVISGFGVEGYSLALKGLLAHLRGRP